jgi:hypothetical protein
MIKRKFVHKIKSIITLIFCGALLIGCSSEKPSDNDNSTTDEVKTSGKESEGKPTESEIRKGVDWFFSTDKGKTIEVGDCRYGHTGIGREKKIDEVSVVKMTDKKKGDPKQMPLGAGEKRDYWAAEVKIMGRCRKTYNVETRQLGPWREFQTRGRYNIYQNDFGEWHAWFRDQ